MIREKGSRISKKNAAYNDGINKLNSFIDSINDGSESNTGFMFLHEQPRGIFEGIRKKRESLLNIYPYIKG